MNAEGCYLSLVDFSVLVFNLRYRSDFIKYTLNGVEVDYVTDFEKANESSISNHRIVQNGIAPEVGAKNNLQNRIRINWVALNIDSFVPPINPPTC